MIHISRPLPAPAKSPARRPEVPALPRAAASAARPREGAAAGGTAATAAAAGPNSTGGGPLEHSPGRLRICCASAVQKSTKRIDQIVKRRDGAGSAHAYRANGIRRGLAEEVRSLARVPGAAKRAILTFLCSEGACLCL